MRKSAPFATAIRGRVAPDPRRASRAIPRSLPQRSVMIASLFLATGGLIPTPSRAQAVHAADVVAQWVALPVPTGRAELGTSIVARSLRGWTRDPFGNLVMRRGTGTPRRVIACGLDEASYVVSEITDEGYVRLHFHGRASHSALWDQFHEGQRIRILTRSGAVPAVVGVRSVHLWRGRGAEDAPTTIDDLWVDVGAHSRAEVERLGIAMLDPVIRELPPWRFADVVAGPAVADRTSCAAVAATAGGTPSRGETTWILSVSHAFAYDGLRAALARGGPVDSLYVVDPSLARDTTRPVPSGISRTPIRRQDLPVAAGVASIAIGAPAMFAGTLVESVREGDIMALVREVANAAGVAVPDSFSVALHGVPGAPPVTWRDDSLSTVAEVLGGLTDQYGVSGHEGPVRAAVSALLPTVWKRQPMRVDTAGDLIVEAGPDRDTTVFVAHLDEIGFRVVSIRHDGTAILAPVGGFFRSLWEGQPALAHLDAQPGARCTVSPSAAAHAGGVPSVPGTLPGIFVPRRAATTKQPDTLSVWFGVDSAGLAVCGVAEGTRISGYKHPATRLAATRFTARSIDDRAGCTALLLALRRLDPAQLRHKVIFVWSVREEVGLNGAAAVAAELGPSVHRVHAIDTFVSSDSPLESRRFAYAPLGHGAALRALDNSGVTPESEIARIVRIAAASRVPLTVGTTNGGNDGSVFVPYGAVNVPIGWPLRYSHSPAEVIDLGDVAALARLVELAAISG